MSKGFEIVTEDYYSNCLIEAVKAKLRDWNNVTITFVSPFDNEVFCPHWLWSDGKYDYDFGYEGRISGVKAWTLHKGHISKYELGHNQRYKAMCKKWRRRHDGKM